MEAMYKGFKIIETMQEGGATTSVAYLFDEAMFGTFSHMDVETSYEKMITKINNYLKNKIK
jgi:hypothetical protein